MRLHEYFIPSVCLTERIILLAAASVAPTAKVIKMITNDFMASLWRSCFPITSQPPCLSNATSDIVPWEDTVPPGNFRLLHRLAPICVNMHHMSHNGYTVGETFFQSILMYFKLPVSVAQAHSQVTSFHQQYG